MTYAELMSSTKAQLQAMLAIGYLPKPTAAERIAINEHLTYRNALEAYSADVANKASAGPGSTPPGNPPPPPIP